MTRLIGHMMKASKGEEIMTKKISLLFLVLLFCSSATLFAQAECNETNYQDYIYNKQKTDRLIAETGQGCVLVIADFSEKDLRNAYLKQADLRGANLERTNLQDVEVFGAIHDSQTTFPQGFNP